MEARDIPDDSPADSRANGCDCAKHLSVKIADIALTESRGRTELNSRKQVDANTQERQLREDSDPPSIETFDDECRHAL